MHPCTVGSKDPFHDGGGPQGVPGASGARRGHVVCHPASPNSIRQPPSRRFHLGWGNVGLRGRCVGRKPHRDCESPNNGIRGGTRQQRPYHCGAPGNVGGATQRGAIWPIQRRRTRHTINGGPQHGAHPTILRPSRPGPRPQPSGALEASWGAVINDGRELECRELLNWLRYALTLRKDPGGTPTALPPGSSLGAIGAALPTLRVDAPLQNHRWNILRQDLPALDPTSLAPTDQVVHLVQALRDEQAATRLAEVEITKPC